MASSSDVHHLPLRSISLPSRTHPSSLKLEAAVARFKASAPLTMTIQAALVGLADMYTSIEETLTSAASKHDLLSYQEELLDESITFMDTCDTARDLLIKMKEQLHNLQSGLRRKRISNESEVAAYMRSIRKMVKKEAMKPLFELKLIERRCERTNRSSVVLKALKEATSMAVSVLRSLLLFVLLPAPRTSHSSMCMSVISKVIMPQRHFWPSKGGKMIMDEGSVDLTLLCLKNKAELERILESHCSNIERIEAGLQQCFKSLLQYRVFVLNIVTQC